MPEVPPEPTQPARGGRTRATAEQRAAAASRVLEGNASVAEVARTLGVHPSTVRRWVREATIPRSGDEVARPGEPSVAGSEPAAPRAAPPAAKAAPPAPEPPVPPAPEPATMPGPEAAKAAPPAPPKQPESVSPAPTAPYELPQPEPAQPELPQPEPARPEPEADLPGRPGEAAQELPSTIDPDRIMPLVDRLRSTHRYVIVVLAWIVMLGVSVLLPGPGPLLGVLQFGHLLGLALAVGAVAVIDWHGLLWIVRRRELRETARIAAAVSPLIWAGLLLLGLTGAALKPDLGTLRAWVKMVAVLVVALNGVAASETRQVLRRVAEGVTLAALPRILGVRMVASAVISQLAWVTTIIIGVATHLSRS